MAKVTVSEPLKKQIFRIFKAESVEIIELLLSLEEYPHKGKPLRNLNGILIKEVKYKKYRFYCLTDGQVLKFGTEDELAELLIKFVRMSEKRDQAKILKEVEAVLRSLGFERF